MARQTRAQQRRNLARERMRAARSGPDKQRHACKERTRSLIRRGKMVRSDVCADCGKTGVMWAYHADYSKPEEVVWLCKTPCYHKREPRRSPSVPVVRRDIRRKLPSYETMKHDFVVNGLTVDQMCEKYNYRHRANLWRCLKRRAEKRGEWPLVPQRALHGHRVRVEAIWSLVVDYLKSLEDRDTVVVTVDSASRHAPRTLLGSKGGRRELWPVQIAKFHLAGCKNLKAKGGVMRPAFSIAREDALDWGYVECLSCSSTLPMQRFSRESGVNETLLCGINSGRVKVISRTQAKRLLLAIGEPIPEWMEPHPLRRRVAS